ALPISHVALADERQQGRLDDALLEEADRQRRAERARRVAVDDDVAADDRALLDADLRGASRVTDRRVADLRRLDDVAGHDVRRDADPAHAAGVVDLEQAV